MNKFLIHISILFIFTSGFIHGFAQDFNTSKTTLSNFLIRMYNSSPFEGVKILQTQDGLDYMISVVGLIKDSSKSVTKQSRMASVKAKAYASQFINGSNISSEVIVISNEKKTKDSVIAKSNLQEIIKESSMGFVQGMELLINFESNNGKQLVFIYYREIKK